MRYHVRKERELVLKLSELEHLNQSCWSWNIFVLSPWFCFVSDLLRNDHGRKKNRQQEWIRNSIWTEWNIKKEYRDTVMRRWMCFEGSCVFEPGTEAMPGSYKERQLIISQKSKEWDQNKKNCKVQSQKYRSQGVRLKFRLRESQENKHQALWPLAKLAIMSMGQHPLTTLFLRTVPGKGIHMGKELSDYVWDVCLVLSELNSLHIRRKLCDYKLFHRQNLNKYLNI